MSVARFLSWLAALLLSAGAGLLVGRYMFDCSGWGQDSVWMLASSVLLTSTVQDALEGAWSAYGADD